MKYLGFVLSVLSGCVMAEEVYYCSDSVDGVGYYQKENGNYDTAYFRPTKFKMKLQDNRNIVIISDDGYKDLYLCSILGENNERKSCVHQYTNGSLFNFNQDKGRYIMFKGFGYVFGVSDTVTAHIGTCTKF